MAPNVILTNLQGPVEKQTKHLIWAQDCETAQERTLVQDREECVYLPYIYKSYCVLA